MRLEIPTVLGRGFLLAVVGSMSLLASGCASTNRVASSNENESAPDPAWYQSDDNPFHAD